MSGDNHNQAGEAHRTTTAQYQHARGEQRAECSCGWVGQHRPTRALALADADLHTEPQRVRLARGEVSS